MSHGPIGVLFLAGKSSLLILEPVLQSAEQSQLLKAVRGSRRYLVFEGYGFFLHEEAPVR